MVRIIAARLGILWAGMVLSAARPISAGLAPLVAQSAPPAPAAQPRPAPNPAPKPPPKRYEFNSTLGFSQTRGNAEALATNLSSKFRYAIAGWSMQQDLAFFYGKANGKINTNFWNGGLRGDRVLHQRMSLFLAARYDRNQLQGITNRFQQGFGLNLLAIDDKRNRLNVSLGGSLFQQELTAGSTVRLPRAFPAARAAFDYRRRFTDLAYIQQNAEYLPAVGDTASSYFVNTETAVVAPLSKSVGLKVGYVIRYNSDPPVRNRIQLRTTDTFFSSGLTLTF